MEFCPERDCLGHAFSNLLVDSGVYAGNTVEQMLTGKQFNRAVRGFTLVFYSLNIIHIAAFIHWCRTFDHFEELYSNGDGIWGFATYEAVQIWV
jgi:hypothetical protein